MHVEISFFHKTLIKGIFIDLNVKTKYLYFSNLELFVSCMYYSVDEKEATFKAQTISSF